MPAACVEKVCALIVPRRAGAAYLGFAALAGVRSLDAAMGCTAGKSSAVAVSYALSCCLSAE